MMMVMMMMMIIIMVMMMMMMMMMVMMMLMLISIVMVDHLATDIMPSFEKGNWMALKAIFIVDADLVGGMGFRGIGRAP